jgi:hypothetical protein
MIFFCKCLGLFLKTMGTNDRSFRCLLAETILLINEWLICNLYYMLVFPDKKPSKKCIKMFIFNSFEKYWRQWQKVLMLAFGLETWTILCWVCLQHFLKKFQNITFLKCFLERLWADRHKIVFPLNFPSCILKRYWVVMYCRTMRH